MNRKGPGVSVRPETGEAIDLRELIADAGSVLDTAGVPSARNDAEILAAHLLGVRRSELALFDDPPEGFRRDYAELVQQRQKRRPLQHIVGVQGFRYLALHVAADVFVPRPETEMLAGLAVDEARTISAGRRPLVVDLCCGAGGIALAVDTEVPPSRVVAIDDSPAAVALTEKNHRDFGTADMRVELGDVTDGDLLADLTGQVDVVVSNPPYIPPDGQPLEPEVRDYDPDAALYGRGSDGLMLPTAVVSTARRLLTPGGYLAIEHDESQTVRLARILGDHGFVDVRARRDFTGRQRASTCRAPEATGPAKMRD